MPSSKSSRANGTGSNRGKQSLRVLTKSKADTAKYLRLYESMVRHQDLEFDATHKHIAMTFGRIQHLGRRGKRRGSGGAVPDLRDEEAESTLGGMLTYLQMRRCLLRLGYTWKRSLPPSSSSSGSVSSGGSIRHYDDDVSVLSVGSVLSGTPVSKSSSSTTGAVRDIIATDHQLIMLLTTLVEMEERHRATMLEGDGDQDEEEGGNDDALFSRGLFLPEFVQAYKLIIGGMQALITFPGPEDQTEKLQKACAGLGMPLDRMMLQDVRSRSRERTLRQLRLFGPDSKLYRDANKVPMAQSAGEPTTLSNKKDGLIQSKRRNKLKKSITAKDGLLPRLTEEEIKRLVYSKDAMLAKIMEEHEKEINLIATNMDVMRLRGNEMQRLRRRRRRCAGVAAIVSAVLLASAGCVYEYWRREQFRVEIATGREAERRADAETIAGLREALALVTAERQADAEAITGLRDKDVGNKKNVWEQNLFCRTVCRSAEQLLNTAQE